MLDVDRVGRLTWAELMAGVARFDTDNDGFITQEELDGKALAMILHCKFGREP